MKKCGVLIDVAEEVEFRVWKNSDEIRSMAIKGDVYFVAILTNTAANLNNAGFGSWHRHKIRRLLYKL